MGMTRFAAGARGWAGIALSAGLLAMYAQGGIAFVLGFVALLPWIVGLDIRRNTRATLLDAWLMSIAFVLAAFPWFAFAIADYLDMAPMLALAVLVVAAPLLQPQIIAFALARHWAAKRHGAVVTMLAAASAWVGCEWLWPKLLGDTFGHGLYPSPWLRQFADVGGTAILTFALLLANQWLAQAFAHRKQARSMWMRPLLLAALVPLLLTGYGAARLSMLSRDASEATSPLRIGMVQTGIVDYERLRAEISAGEVMRRVLDAHFSQSWPLAKSGQVDALLWSETVYPTTYGHPKSEAGAAFDSEVAAFVREAGVPLVFGTYDRDSAGEYNAAAFVEPATPLLGFYRKTRLFFATEYLPHWMDAVGLRRLLPWAGTWRPGSGARVMPLRLADGREIPVQVLICLDDVDTRLALDGARQGAQALLGMSNDSWFTRHPLGARLHLQVAAFRSIETRLPQARVTSNGLSAVIDAGGGIVAQSRMGETAVLVGALQAREPPMTLMRLLGDWVGLVGLGWLGLLAAIAARGRWLQRFPPDALPLRVPLPTQVAVLTPPLRGLIAALQLFARVSVLWLALAWWLDQAGQGRQLTQLRSFAMWVLAPELLAWALLGWHRARLAVDGGMLKLVRRGREWRVARQDIMAMRAWMLPLPGEGVDLHVAHPPKLSLADVAPAALAEALGIAPASDAHEARRLAASTARTQAYRRAWDHPLVKFGLFPLLPALIAFRLHQMITFGGTFGEAQTFGWAAWFTALGLWWARWIVNLVLLAGVLRAAIELICLPAQRLAPSRIGVLRRVLEAAARWAYYLGVPAWLAWRIGWG